MAENTGREGEEALFEIIRSPSRLDDLNEANDGSQYLNYTEEGDDKIFDLDDRADEVMNYDYDYDDTDNVDLEITKTTGEVYLYKQASSDHHMFFLFEDILTNRSFFFQPSGSSKSASTRHAKETTSLNALRWDSKTIRIKAWSWCDVTLRNMSAD